MKERKKQRDRQTDVKDIQNLLRKTEVKDPSPPLNGEDERERKQTDRPTNRQTEIQTDIKDLQNLLRKRERWK